MVKLDEATLTSQGQVSVPKKVRMRLHLEKGDRIAFFEDEKGRVFIQEVETPVDFSVEEWGAFLEKTEKEPVTRVSGKKAAMEHLEKLGKHK